MIKNDEELRATQNRITTLQEVLLSLRKKEKPSNYLLMSKGYLMEINKMQAEILEYLSLLIFTIEGTHNGTTTCPRIRR